jgi:hypothetical protein
MNRATPSIVFAAIFPHVRGVEEALSPPRAHGRVDALAESRPRVAEVKGKTGCFRIS